MSRRPSRAADLLAIDVGNSKVQGWLLRGGEERFRWRLPYGPQRGAWQRACAQALQLARQDMHRRVPVVLASVAPARAAVIEALLRRARVGTLHRVTWRDPWPFRLALRHPETVGVDRLANVAGLVALGYDEGIVIDAGTAVTIDVLRRRRFVGGLILPGASLMSQALQAHTAQLPPIDWRGAADLMGDDTQSALRAGILHGLTHAVAGLTRSLRSRLGAGAVALVTGGQSADLATAVPALRWEPDLTFLGLRLLAARARLGRGPQGPRPGKKA